MDNPGRDAVRFEPPPLSAPMAAILTGHRDDAQILGALVLDLAARDWFAIEAYSGGWALRSAARLPGRGELTAAEKLFLDAAFVPSLTGVLDEDAVQQYVSLTSLKRRLSGCTHAMARAVGEDLVNAGLARRNPLTTSGLRGKAWTAEGVAVREACAGFRKYLQTAEAGSLVYSSKTWEVQRYLGFAVAFGIADRWARSLDVVGLELQQLGRVTNPAIMGIAAGVEGGFNLEALFTASVVQSYVNRSGNRT